MTLIWAVGSSALAGLYAHENHPAILAGAVLFGYLFCYDLARDIITTIMKGKGNGQ